MASQVAIGSAVAFGRVKDDVNRAAEVVPRLPEDTDFEAPLGGELEEIEPLVVRRLGGIEAFDIARIDVYRVDGGLAIIEPECCVIAGWRLVRRACRVGIGFQRAVGASISIDRRGRVSGLEPHGR